jgi:hypothetical protein
LNFIPKDMVEAQGRTIQGYSLLQKVGEGNFADAW